MYWINLIGWMFLTLGACVLVFPLFGSDDTAGYSAGSVITAVVLLALGAAIVAGTRSRHT